MTESTAPTAVPTGEVTFVFTDIVSSTRLWDEAAAMSDALWRHDELLRTTFRTHGGFVFSATGDGFGVAFQDPAAAVVATVEAQRALRDATWPPGATIRVRMGIHVGVAAERDRNYFGPPVNRAARLMSVADGQEVLVSGQVRDRARNGLPGDVELVALGSFELKDVVEPVALYTVRADGVEMARPPDPARAAAAGNLPAPATTIIGRDADVDAAVEGLHDGRLVTLVGPGGVGKTSLALEVARRLEEFPDGRWLVRLGTVDDEAGVLPAVHAALGQSAPTSTLEQLVGGALRDRRLLIVVDNCEHVVDEVGRIVGAILAGAPNVGVLATSREPLHVEGERRVPVAPLAAHDAASPAVDLFLRCAKEAGADIDATDRETIARVCRRLDGLPLAIELAAAKSRILSPDELLGLLDDRFRLLRAARTAEHRHRTLRDTFQWSYEMLDGRERRVFDRLGVIATRFDIDDAMEICADDDVTRPDVVDAVVTLADKSLISPTGASPPFELLESIRELARERLADGDEADRVRGRHARRLRNVAAEVRATCIGPRERETAELVHARSADFEAAARWAASNGELDLALGIVVDLNAFGSQRGWRRAPTWIAHVLDDPPSPLPAQWPDFLAASATTALNERAAVEHARRLAQQALELDAGNPQALLVLAHLARRPGECYRYATELVESGTARDDLNWKLDGLSYQAFGLLVTGNYLETLEVAQRLNAEGVACGDRSTVGWSRYFTARALSSSDPARALVLLEEAREIADETANPTLEISTRRQRIATLLAGGDPEAAIASARRLVLRTLEFGETDQALRTCQLGAIALAAAGRDDDAARLIGRLGLPSRTRDDHVEYRRIEQELAERLGDRYDTGRQEWSDASASRTIELALSALS